MTKGYRSSFPPRRGRRVSTPPKDETPEAPATEEGGEMEVEMQSGAAAETEE